MKLRLKKLMMSDAAGLKIAINNKEVIDCLESVPYPYKVSDAKKYIKKSLEKSKKKETYEFVILVDGEFVGTIVLENPSTSKKSFEVGYFIAREHWGKGIATRP